MPSQKATKAMELWKSGNYDGLYELASSRLKSELPKDFFLSQNSEKEFPVLLAYRISKKEQKAETARIVVSVSVPDFPRLPGPISTAIINGRVSDNQIREILAKGATVEKSFDMELLRERDGWMINDFEPFDHAADLYRKKIEAQAYRESIKILSIKASRTDPSLGDDLVMIEGKIENLGEEPLSMVELTVRFKNSDERILREAKIYPILISGCTSSDVAKHIQNSGDFRTYINMTEEWSGGVEGEITDIELGDGHSGCGG